MPEVPINYLAVLSGGIVSMIVGSLWYGPLFGKQWIAMMGMGKDAMDASKKKGMGKLYAMAFVGALVMSYVLAHALVFASTYLQVEGPSAGLMAGFWNWLGFIAPVTLGSVIWEGKSWNLWLLHNGYQLITLLLIGVILAVWK